MRPTSTLTAGVALIGALLSSGLALAQPASMGDAVDPVDTGPGQGMSFTLRAGAGADEGYKDVNFGGALALGRKRGQAPAAQEAALTKVMRQCVFWSTFEWPLPSLLRVGPQLSRGLFSIGVLP
jgi:hypothetical protein